MISQALLAAHLPVAPPPDPLESACGPDPGIACRLAWDITHNTTAAQLARVWLARPAARSWRSSWWCWWPWSSGSWPSG